MQSNISLIIDLWKNINTKNKFTLTILSVGLIITAIIELLTIVLIGPLVSTLLNNNNNKLQSTIFGLETLDIEKNSLILIISTFFIILFFVGTILKLTTLYYSSKIAANIGIYLSTQLYEKLLDDPFELHLNYSSSEKINEISHRTNVIIYWVILPILTVISSFTLLILISLALIWLMPFIMLSVMIIIFTSYYSINRYVRSRLHSNGVIIDKSQTEIIKILNIGIGAIKNIKIDKTSQFFTSKFYDEEKKLRNKIAINDFLGTIPRPVIEFIGISILIIICIILNSSNTYSEYVPFVATLAFAAQRTLPAIQQMYSSWSSITGANPILNNVNSQLLKFDQPKHQNNSNKLIFEEHISLNNIQYSYDDPKKQIINNLNLKIVKNSKIAIIGDTGCGKSTLINIILGLLQPKSGTIKIDKLEINNSNIDNYHNLISFIPQDVYILHDTLSANVAFGQNIIDYDYNKMSDCLSKALIVNDFVNLPEQFDTMIGDNAKNISGGQKQRLAIARALYKDSEILIFDEATSALDRNTENAIIKTISNLKNKTIIFVTHKIELLNRFDRVLELKDGYLHERKT